ncbi:hypothetical protein [Halomonas sp. BL6]|uniref:hypothetical protein n=1 Tax=Halomonas sp. BL6 TaxID=2585770 RepID=UPI001117FD31|nr:hypothetical protein [Halomonas sp. BL6]TNH19991.1 hypothetical protein FHJ80_02085 [Halomonas sp. BL6]
MSKQEKKGFFCELKPVTVGNNIPAELRAIVNFYFEKDGENSFKVRGYSDTGLMKEGQAELVYDNESERPEIKGSFLESSNEILFKIEPLNIFDTDVFFGSGVWTESLSDGSARQKYNIKIWDAGFENQRLEFLSLLFKKNKELSNGLDQSSEDIQRQENQLKKLKDSLAEAEQNVGLINQHSNTLAEVLAETKTNFKELEGIKKEASEAKNELNSYLATNTRTQKTTDDLLNKSRSILDASHTTQQEADKILGSAVTVQLAKSFKERKEAASAQRHKYDKVFYVGLTLALIVSAIVFTNYDVDSDSFLSYFQYFLTRLPLVVVPVWLAVFASKKSALLIRLEEFYAQKQTLAESYEGYKSRLSELGDDASEDLLDLMRINLLSISRDSTCVIDSASKEKHSPMEELVDLIKRRGRNKNSQPNESTGE